ncbi:UNVERIFIED_CONTAM: Retrovirus-related Pol polyprotein from transposon RE1 [Sesamum calycinum]|uniref:Retrovirus-related Pol polyprotein from transposon RE1 n=1 Tax=Sesamum calycinum TaxID=2727403 RepID=A0AAW2IWP5_9LAMI
MGRSYAERNKFTRKEQYLGDLHIASKQKYSWLQVDYKTKLKPDGSTKRYKERLVAKGFSQVEGIDYNDRFASVAKAITVRLFLAVATARNWPPHHLDLNNAFLHGTLDPPEGYQILPGMVCKLKKSYTAESRLQDNDILVSESTDELIQEVKRDTGMHKGMIVITPLPPGLKLSTDLGGALPNLSKYKSLPDYKNITNEILHIFGFKPSLLENKGTDSYVKVLYRSRIQEHGSNSL